MEETKGGEGNTWLYGMRAGRAVVPRMAVPAMLVVNPFRRMACCVVQNRVLCNHPAHARAPVGRRKMQVGVVVGNARRAYVSMV